MPALPTTRLLLTGIALSAAVVVAFVPASPSGAAPTADVQRAADPWKAITTGTLLSGTWSLQLTRTSDGKLHVPFTVQTTAHPNGVTYQVPISSSGRVGTRVAVDPTGCSKNHALLALPDANHTLLGVAGGLPLTGCASDEMNAYRSQNGGAFSRVAGYIQWGNHAYNAGRDALSLLALSSTRWLSAYAAPEGLVIGRSDGGYSSGNKTPVFSSCCATQFPSLAQDLKTKAVWVGWLEGQVAGPNAVAVQQVNPTTGAPIGSQKLLAPPKAQAKLFRTSDATQRVALTGTDAAAGVFAGFLGRGDADTHHTTVWLQGIGATGCPCPAPAAPKKVFGRYAGLEQYGLVTVAATQHSRSNRGLWLLASVYRADGTYAFVGRHWTKAKGWGRPTLITFPRGQTDGLFDYPFALMADAQRGDGKVDVISTGSGSATRLYHRLVTSPSTKARYTRTASKTVAHRATYRITLPAGVYIASGTHATLRYTMTSGGKPTTRTVSVSVSVSGKASWAVTSKAGQSIALRSLSVTTGDFANVYPLSLA